MDILLHNHVFLVSLCFGTFNNGLRHIMQVKDHALDTEKGVKSLQGQICGVEFLYLWNSFPQVR